MKKLKICSGCDQEKPIWKNHEGEKYCQYCWNSIKHKDKKPSVKRKRIKAKSAKMIELNKMYSQLRTLYLKEHLLCEAGLQCCTGPTTDVHHMDGRGVNYLVVATWLPVCRTCHSWIHEHPKEARELNLLI